MSCIHDASSATKIVSSEVLINKEEKATKTISDQKQLYNVLLFNILCFMMYHFYTYDRLCKVALCNTTICQPITHNIPL